MFFKYIFFGTPEFAAIILEELIKADLKPSVVVCNPDRPIGREKVITPPPTKVIAKKHNIKVYQPEKLDINEFKNEIGEIDLAVIAAYAKIIPNEILNLSKMGVIGIHPSLLPKYRGPSPIQEAILRAEKETGVTLFILDEKIDHGSIIARTNLKIEETDNYKTLHDKLALLGAELLIKTLPDIEDAVPKPQNENEATFTKKIKIEDAFIDLEKDDPKTIWQKIKALNPEPGVWTINSSADGSKRMKILEADFIDNKIILRKIQFAGEKPKILKIN
ncbi:MAG: methionyl-tRNA formyltransferase [Patescibacteria group bacterium]|nr:methionyl-tRNA formyltransferase [Patescibacteria group bacterium]